MMLQAPALAKRFILVYWARWWLGGGSDKFDVIRFEKLLESGSKKKKFTMGCTVGFLQGAFGALES